LLSLTPLILVQNVIKQELGHVSVATVSSMIGRTKEPKIDFGVHSTHHKHDNFREERRALSTPSGERDDKLAAVGENCSTDWPQSSYGSDANSNITQWATYNTQCAYDTLTTDIESIGTRNSYAVQTDPEGNIIFNENTDFETNVFTNDFSNTLPSLNLNFGLTDDVQLRFAAYAALSRPDMWYFGSGRNIGGVDAADEFGTVEEALQGNVRASGNPFLEALESNNLDLSLNYFAGEDTLISLGLYHKTFDARIESQSAIEDVVVDGQTFAVEVQGRPTIIDDSSTIQGLELTVQHRFTNLPAPFNGLGVVLNYNHADSDFQTPEAGGNISADVRAQIAPSNIAGLSDNTISSQLYWENDDFSARLSYKYRSEYLKPFGSSLAQTNRFVDDQSTLDLDLSYDISKQLTARFQVINITNNPYVEQRVAHEAYNRIEYSGVRYFMGLKYRM